MAAWSSLPRKDLNRCGFPGHNDLDVSSSDEDIVAQMERHAERVSQGIGEQPAVLRSRFQTPANTHAPGTLKPFLLALRSQHLHLFSLPLE